MAFDYEIQYKKGRENVAVDALLRVQGSTLLYMAIEAILPQLLDSFKASWLNDTTTQQLISDLKKDPSSYPSFT